jgi:hypothetical protein
MFIAALIIIAKPRKQSRCPTTHEWIKNVVFIYNGILFSHKNNEMLSFAGKWMELEFISLNEVSQVLKGKGHVFSFICGIKAKYKYRQYYIHIEIYTEHVSKSGTGREDQGRGKKERKIANNNKIHHTCAGTRQNETH